MEIATANECSGEPRKARKARKANKKQLTVQERELVLAACDFLAENDLPITGKSVALRLQIHVPADSLRALVRHRKKQFGKSTTKFRESIEEFAAFADARSDASSILQFAQVNLAPEVFSWIGFFCPFWDRLQELREKHNFTHWACATDFTSRICHMEYHYGFLCGIAFKQQDGCWKKGALPLVGICAPTECKDIYRLARKFIPTFFCPSYAPNRTSHPNNP